MGWINFFNACSCASNHSEWWIRSAVSLLIWIWVVQKATLIFHRCPLLRSTIRTKIFSPLNQKRRPCFHMRKGCFPRVFLGALRLGVTQNRHKARSVFCSPPRVLYIVHAFNAIVLRGTKARCKKNNKHGAFNTKRARANQITLDAKKKRPACHLAIADIHFAFYCVAWFDLAFCNNCSDLVIIFHPQVDDVVKRKVQRWFAIGPNDVFDCVHQIISNK